MDSYEARKAVDSGQRVKVTHAGTRETLYVGSVKGYHGVPTFLIELADGTFVHWRIDLCEATDEPETTGGVWIHNTVHEAFKRDVRRLVDGSPIGEAAEFTATTIPERKKFIYGETVLHNGSVVLDNKGRAWTVTRDGGMVMMPVDTAEPAPPVMSAGIYWLSRNLGPLEILYEAPENYMPFDALLGGYKKEPEL